MTMPIKKIDIRRFLSWILWLVAHHPSKWTHQKRKSLFLPAESWPARIVVRINRIAGEA